MNSLTKKFNQSFLLFVSFIFLMAVFWLYQKHTVGNDSTISEWIINYQGGLTRRGLIGEICFQLAVFFDLKLKPKKIIIIPFNTLTINLCKKYNASIIIRGLRAVSDFEYEFQLAGMNKKLNNNIETIFLMSDIENQIISSKFVKEIAKLKGNINKFVTKSVIKSIKEKI